MSAGYSGTALVAKLGIKPGMELHVVDAPEDYRELVAPLPDGTRVVRTLSGTTDIVHVFSSRKAQLASALRTCRKALKPTAAVWVSWPKKAAKLPTDITEDTIREVALPLGFVDIKVCAVSDTWSGLKLVVRKELR
jgi:Protein of unknown function (DUF3052)